MDIVYEATLTCPECGAEHRETMTDSSCQFFYRCDACNVVLRPAEGDCCVFCTYADVPCPPIQRERAARAARRRD
jgi:hypothetical protein